MTRKPEDGMVLFQTSGSVLALIPYQQLAANIGAGWNVPRSTFPGITLAHDVRERYEVDDLLARAAAAGAEVVTPARETGWGGYGGYFTDPDGYVGGGLGAFEFNDDGSLRVA